jgi:hypothetical protein
MANTDTITKRVAISKANAQMVTFVAVASFVTIFSLVAAKTLWSQSAYQSRVISAKNIANKQLVQNINSYNILTASYKTLVDTPTNVIGGQSSGSGSKDGNNAKIILDALPPAYDFPALTATIGNILTTSGLKVSNISGIDDEINQLNNTTSPDPQPISMPFSFNVNNSNYQAVSQLVNTLQLSIRPIQIDTILMSGSASDMTFTISAHTYYQPSKSLSITKRVVK